MSSSRTSLFTIFIVQGGHENIGWGTFLRTLPTSKYRPPKKRLMSAAERALYHGTELPFFTIVLFGHVL